MRTTLTLHDDLAMALQEKARREGRPFKDVVNEAIRRGLQEAAPTEEASRFHVRTYAMGYDLGMDLTKASQLAGRMEDEHILQRMREFEEEQRQGTES